MIRCDEFYDILKVNGIDFFTGVPDSLLKSFCAYLYDNTPEENNIIAANEGSAVALASGYHLATGRYALVYMQNSGEGNALNPLVSLMDKDVFSIPALLMIGWRGEPGKKDEPQHVKQGEITLSLLNTIGIPYKVIPKTIEEAGIALKDSIDLMKKINSPVAVVIRKGIFEDYSINPKSNNPEFDMSREDAIKAVIDQIGPSDVVVSTTGMISRELFEYREAVNQKHELDFLTVGSMGHSSQIALGIAMFKKNRDVYCFDGDGAVIMHMGGMATVGSLKIKNFKHVVFNNGAHDSVGGQPTAGMTIDIPAIAKSCGYLNAYSARTMNELNDLLPDFINSSGPSLLEVMVRKGARKDLGRPTGTPQGNKQAFMSFLKEE